MIAIVPSLDFLDAFVILEVWLFSTYWFFCVGSLCLHEYWYYSVFTLFMLFMFESTMAKSRLKTLSELRRMRVDSQVLMVYHCGKWTKVTGTELLPGDVVSIGCAAGQDGEENSFPAAMLILAGTTIVNEAILTGDSSPQWKVSIMGRGLEECLSSKRDKNHVLFGGTKILQHTPDKVGCLAIVLRTRFETTQGKLMRTVLFSTKRVTCNSWESRFFILFLVVFAIIAAGYVLKKGFEDPNRSRYKLLLSYVVDFVQSLFVYHLLGSGHYMDSHVSGNRFNKVQILSRDLNLNS
ncbi:unnamed protein product [Lactuca virosa]|uniref:P-type ATPase A domain-containing protein n=1 Tax=Lactuca virosa TaxID=75947 RepID=A0AAU9M394_9ASTR|nr:unnamed protein product [Lactuca virosa]